MKDRLRDIVARQYGPLGRHHTQLQEKLMASIPHAVPERQRRRWRPIGRLLAGDGTITITERIFKMNRIRHIAAAVIIVAAVAGTATFLTLGNGGATSAWAAVQETIRNAQTCAFRMTVHMQGLPGMELKVMVTESGLMRQEMIKPDRGVTIMDFRTGKALSLMEEQKMAIIIEFSGLMEEAAEELRKQFQQQNMMDHLKRLIEEAETELGEKEIAGRPAIGYQVKMEDIVMTAWVDAETGKLLEMEMTFFQGETRMVMSDFEFGMELSDDLFSMEVPEGYTVMEHKMELKPSSFEDVAILLGVMARMNDGVFPDSLPGNHTIAAYMKDLQGLDKVLGAVEDPKVILRLADGVVFLKQMHPAGHYAGAGVKHGDAETPIFWYRPKDSETYKVIYGDLSIKDVAEEDLPTEPEEATDSE